MIDVERSRTIAAEPSGVWAVLADYGAISGWAPNVDHSCLLSADGSGVGARRRVQVGRSALVETIRTWDPPSELSYSVEGLPRIVRSVVNTWRVRSGAGGAHVTLTSEIDTGPRPLQKLVARIVGLKLASASEEMLEGLAAHLRAMETPP